MISLIGSMRRIWLAERGMARPLRILMRSIELIAGRSRAFTQGWRDGFIGDFPRIIGSGFISTGSECSVGRFAWIEVFSDSIISHPYLRLGDRFSASERLHISCSNHIEFGNDCLLGSCVHVTDHNHGSYKGQFHSTPYEKPLSRPVVSHGSVLVGDRVWIGDNCVLIGPLSIGDGAIIGANSVVTSDLPSNVIAVGAPARIVKEYNPSSRRWDSRSTQTSSTNALA
jgi:acetyltransferase-like isoleucine patch superfamily enzyme